MSWDLATASQLLAVAFPWGATVNAGERRFVTQWIEVSEHDFGADRCWISIDMGGREHLVEVTSEAMAVAASSGRVDGAQASLQRPEADDVGLMADGGKLLVGPQADSDAAWVRRMRLHQSWWRTFRLRVPFGTGPNKGSTTKLGNMLDDRGDVEGLNFLSDEARLAYDQRIAATPAGVEPWRTRRNLLASQPMAFNLFGHLAGHSEIAAALFTEILGEEVHDPQIEIERLSDALSDRTAFDAFVTYRRADDTPGCIAIETKLTEPFSQKAYDWEQYAAHTAFDPEAWQTIETSVLGDPRWSQLWRNHLLARAETARDPLLGPATVLVVHHPLDPHCAGNVDDYRELLTSPDTVKAVHLGTLADLLEPIVETSPANRGWLEDLRGRYIDLEASEPLVGLL